MFEFVLVVYLFNDYKNPEYVGHFENCAEATLYKQKHYPKHQSSICMFEKYIHLPEGLIKKEIK
jgi:hypothetical protein